MPIIQSLLDTDYYKLTMGQFAWRRYPDVLVKYAFKNRTLNVPLAEIIPEKILREEFGYIRALRFKSEELSYLKNIRKSGGERMFGERYLEFLRDFQLPPYRLERIGDTYKIEFPGKWQEVIYWETPALAIVNELYNSYIYKNFGFKLEPEKIKDYLDNDFLQLLIGKKSSYCSFSDSVLEGIKRLNKKVEILKLYPEIKIIEFGTRRRYSRWHQEYVLQKLLEQIPDQIIGTSNVYLAKKYGIPAMGTIAHECFMIMSGIMHESDEQIRSSHNKVLREWWDEYGYDLSVALTDTYGSDFFFQDFTPEQAKMWKGLREDSGDPIASGEKAIAFYKNFGINLMEKLIVFSDGLDVHSIVKIYNHFRGRIQMAFGWGTNLTNDLGIRALSLVIKAVEACGHRLVKLSNNFAKAIGKPEGIKRFKRIFGYTATLDEQCRY